MAKYTYSIGRRKTASAQVRMFSGKGTSMINGKPAPEYVTRKDLFETIYSPLRLCKQKDECYFEAQVVGSGEKGQAEAIRLGLAR
jgi:small subunit ribosomal protein S9